MAKVASQFIENALSSTVLQEALTEASEVSEEPPQEVNIKVRTARRWLQRMGFEWKTIGKGVYLDGHEREGVIAYRQTVMIPRWLEMREKRLEYDPAQKSWSFSKLRVRSDVEKPMVLVTNDGSTFNANDGNRRRWLQKDQQPLRPRGKESWFLLS